MDAIRSWAMSVCLAALAAGIAGMLAPKGNLEKIFRFAISLFFLCSVLVPLFALRGIRLTGPTVSTASGQVSDFNSAVAQMSMEQVKDSLADQIKGVCTGLGVTPLSVEVDVQKTQDGSYDPKGARITLAADQMSKANAVAAAVRQNLGFSAQVSAG